jgi:hypothetical protein
VISAKPTSGQRRREFVLSYLRVGRDLRQSVARTSASDFWLYFEGSARLLSRREAERLLHQS